MANEKAAAPAAPESSLPGPDTPSSIEGAQSDTPITEGSGSPQAPETPPAAAAKPQGGSDEDDEREFKSLSVGVQARIKKLQEQRNQARAEAKKYDFFKPYANEPGQKYLQQLVDFDNRLSKSFDAQPWLKDLVIKTVVQGGEPDWKWLQEITGKNLAGAKAAVSEMQDGLEGGEGADPVKAEIQKIRSEVDGWKAQQLQREQEAHFQAQVQQEKTAMKTEIGEFEAAHPQIKGNREFIRRSIQLAMAGNTTFKQAAEDLMGLTQGMSKAQLQQQATKEKDAEGAQVLRTGQPAVQLKTMPKIGSDEQRDAMMEFYGLKD